jgi:hypothetical protein
MNVLMLKVNLSDLYLVVNGMIFKYQWGKKYLQQYVRLEKFILIYIYIAIQS